MSVIVYGPQGCGKSTHAELLREHFGMQRVVDDAADPYPKTKLAAMRFKAGDTLYLTNQGPPYPIDAHTDRRIHHFDQAMRDVTKRQTKAAKGQRPTRGRHEAHR